MSGRRSPRRGSSAWRSEARPVVTALDPPVTIGLISDTHIFQRSERRVPEPVVALFRRFEVGLIAHLGDVMGQRVLDQLGEVAPVLAVVGNNDVGEIPGLPLRRELHIGDARILLLHGHGGRSARAVAEASTADYDCLVYGHSHKPAIERLNDTLVVNPGSPTDRRWNPHFGIAILHVGVDRIDPELILFLRPDELRMIHPLPPVAR